MRGAAAATARPVILIVEDQPLLRELVVELVEDAGFLALAAGDAAKAVTLLEARSDIAVLFTDVNMPGPMNGVALAHLVHHRWPRIKILVASAKLQPPPSDLPSHSAFLRKPYRGAAMVARLRSLMDLDLVE